MAKKKKKAKKAGNPKPRRPAKSQGFAPSAPASLEGLLRKFTSGRGKLRSPLAIAQEIADLAWEAPRPQEQAELARQALSVSPDCADAYVILANQAASRDQARQLLEEGVAAGQRAIGPKTFETAAGRFWLDQRTRPYMRARLGLAQCLWESGQRAQAAEHYAEMLRLNPNDNQGVRYLLLGGPGGPGPRRGCPTPVAALRARCFGRMGLHDRLAGLSPRGRFGHFPQLVAGGVRHAIRYVPDYLVGNKSMPPAPPSYISLGGEDEAISYAAQFLRTWRSSPGAIPWLRKTLKVPLPQPPKPRKPAWSLFRHAFLRLPQVDEEVWQLDVCRLPLSQADGKAYRPPWALVLWNRTEDAILTFEAGDAQPTVGEAWDVLIEALLASPLRRTAPAGGDPGAAQDLPQGLAGKAPADRHPLPALR